MEEKNRVLILSIGSQQNNLKVRSIFGSDTLVDQSFSSGELPSLNTFLNAV